MFALPIIKKLSTIYSSSVLRELGRNEYSSKIRSLLTETKLVDYFSYFSISAFFEEIYHELINTYKNEYIYKNTLINKIYLDNHSVKSASMFTEFSVGSSIADVVFFNGTSTVYEIKTEYDSFLRLSNQLIEYKKVFDRINVVIHEKHLKNLYSQISDDIGIFVFNDSNELLQIKQAGSNIDNVENLEIFKCMRKDEYLKVIKKYFGYIPDVPNTLIYKTAGDLINQLDKKELHTEFVQILGNRNSSDRFANFINALPYSLKALATTTSYRNLEQKKIILSLTKPIY